MGRYRFIQPRYRSPNHPMGAWAIFGIGALLNIFGALNNKPLALMTGSTIAGLAAMYLFPWYAVKNVLRDHEREQREYDRD